MYILQWIKHMNKTIQINRTKTQMSKMFKCCKHNCQKTLPNQCQEDLNVFLSSLGFWKQLFLGKKYGRLKTRGMESEKNMKTSS